MLIFVGIILAILAIPVALILAIALGPVIVTVLFALGTAAVVAAIANVPLGLGTLGVNGYERAKSRRLYR